MRVLLPLDQRLQSEDKDETDIDNNDFVAKSGDDDLERKPSPVYHPIFNDTVISVPDSFSVGDSYTSLSKLAESTVKSERRPRKRFRVLQPLQSTCVSVERGSPILDEFRSADVSTISYSNLQRLITSVRSPDSKPKAAFVPESALDKHQSTTQRGTNKLNHSAMAGGRRRYDSDDENTVDQNSDLARSKSRQSKLKGSAMMVTPAENEPPNYNNRPVSVQNQSILVSTAKENLSEERDTNPSSSIMEYTLVLKKMGLELVEQEGDGNCLFRAVSLQVYGHADHHVEVRERCMDFIASNEEHYSDFVAADIDEQSTEESFAGYIARKRRNGVHGNHTEIQAISELYNRPVEVYTPDSLQHIGNDNSNEFTFKPINIFQTDYKSSEFPIRLSYHDGNHYNAIIDPLVPTAGLGLGLPGLQPGLADKMQVAAAVTASDQIADLMELDRILKESTVEHQKKSAEDENDDIQRAMKESTYSMDMVSEIGFTCLSFHSTLVLMLF
jgi:OTU-like cysteine protease